MQLTTKFEAYNLEELCNDFNLELGDQLITYIVDEILQDEMDACFKGMEYSLIYMQAILDAMADKFSNEDDTKQIYQDLFNFLNEFMNDKDDSTLVYVQGW